jgi:hypothetical protein
MSPEEIRKLLSGYATGSLDAGERHALFEAALEDQELFDLLAKEEALREVMADSSVRPQLLDALGPVRARLAERAWRWLRRPAGLALLGGTAALLIMGVVVLHEMRKARREPLLAEEIEPKRAPSPAAAAPVPVTPPAKFASPPKPAAKEAAVAREKVQPLAAPATPPPANTPEPSPPRPPDGSLAAPPLAQPRDLAASRQDAVSAMQAPAPVAGAQGRIGPGMDQFAKKLPTAPPAATNPPIQYTLLVKDADGIYSPAPSGSVFHTGDSVRLQVASREAGFVYLLLRTGDGWSLVASQTVAGDQRYELPASGELHSSAQAQMELRLVFSRESQDTRSDALASVAGGRFLPITLEFR